VPPKRNIPHASLEGSFWLALIDLGGCGSQASRTARQRCDVACGGDRGSIGGSCDGDLANGGATMAGVGLSVRVIGEGPCREWLRNAIR